MIVLKFGGALLDGVEGGRRVLAEIEQVDADALVVVSAFGGMTNRLEALAARALFDPEGASGLLDAIVADYRAVARGILDEAGLADWDDVVEGYRVRLAAIIEGLSITGELSARTLDLVVHFGELLSSATLSRAIGAVHIPAPDLLITDDRHRYASIRLAESRRRVERDLLPRFTDPGRSPRRVVTEGYIARGEGGEITTMGRETSDYSAALFGALLGAEEVRIYTAVPGVMTADPKLFADARTIEGMSYGMAREIARLGARILHPRTVRPVEENQIPLVLTDLDRHATLIDGDTTRDASSFPLLKNVGLIRCELTATTGGDDGVIDFVRSRRPIIRSLRVGRRLSIVTDGWTPEIAEEITAHFPDQVVRASTGRSHLISAVRERGVGVLDASRFLGGLESRGVVTFWGDPDERSISALIEGEEPEEVLARIHRQFLPA